MEPIQNNSLMHISFQRWEEAKKERNRQINYRIMGIAASIPATILAIGGSCVIWKYGINEPDEYPFVNMASFVSSIALPLIPALLAAAANITRIHLKKDFFWTIKEINTFENTLREKALSSIDWQMMEIAAKSGVISFENYETWWMLLEKNIQLLQKKERHFNLEITPTNLVHEIQEDRQNYILESEHLEKAWEQLKEALLSDLPSEIQV